MGALLHAAFATAHPDRCKCADDAAPRRQTPHEEIAAALKAMADLLRQRLPLFDSEAEHVLAQLEDAATTWPYVYPVDFDDKGELFREMCNADARAGLA